MAFMNDLSGVLLVFSLSRESKSVLGLSIRNLVDPVRMLQRLCLGGL